MFKKHKIQKVIILLLCFFIASYLIYFPGQQSIIAFVIGTGLNIDYLQKPIKEIEKKVISNEELMPSEKVFLSNLYTCFYKGAKVTYVFRQTSALMEHYLSCSGKPLTIDSRIFVNSRKVIQEMNILKRRILGDYRAHNLKTEYFSESFHMGDSNFPDSFTGLYYGTLFATVSNPKGSTLLIQWKADHPWYWPSFKHISEKFSSLESHNFPIPNAMSLIFGKKHSLYINDGLGEYLVKINLAKPFNAYSYWKEAVEIK